MNSLAANCLFFAKCKSYVRLKLLVVNNEAIVKNLNVWFYQFKQATRIYFS